MEYTEIEYQSVSGSFVGNNQICFIYWVWGLSLDKGIPTILIHNSGVLGSIPGLATYFRFSFRFFKKGSCQLLAKVCAQSTG